MDAPVCKPYLSIGELAELTPWTGQAIRTMMSRGVLREGEHFFYVGRRPVFKWAAIVAFIEHGVPHRASSALPRTVEPMGRKRKVRRQACSVEVTATGLLRFRFRWKMPDGVVRKFAEATALRDTPENRERVERQAEMVGAEIRGGAFDYLKWFPNGNRATEFLVASGAPMPEKLVRSDRRTVRDYYTEWIERKIAPFVRASAARDYRGHFRGYVLDVLGDVALEELSLAHLEDLRGTSAQTRPRGKNHPQRHRRVFPCDDAGCRTR